MLRIFIKLAQPTFFVLLIMGCKHNVEPKEPIQDKTIITETDELTLWHDGSKGGEYGIGEDWSIEILRPDYETATDTVVIGGSRKLIVLPAELEWVKDDSEDLSGAPIMITTIITLPAKYEAVTDTIIIEREKPEYYLTNATYKSDGTIQTARAVNLRIIPAVTKEETRQVIKTPERTVERTIPLERRKGYRRVVKIPARMMEDTTPFPDKTVTRKIQKQPWRFAIKNPDKQVVHIFNDFEKLTAFTASLK